MSTSRESIHDPTWRERLGLARRRPPELYDSSSPVEDVPHAPALRAALDDIGLTAVFCVQGVPTVAILKADEYIPGAVMKVHAQLWNQGLASLLLVVSETTLRVFSLARKPFLDTDHTFETRCLIDTLEGATEVFRFRDLISGAESGRIWQTYSEYFPSKERIDQVFLDNLKAAHDQLKKQSLESSSAQALLIQTMFIAYLEDREIVTPGYFEQLSENRVSSFSSLLETSDIELLYALFDTLRVDFNGDLFVAPCSFERQTDISNLTSAHMRILARFRFGS